MKLSRLSPDAIAYFESDLKGLAAKHRDFPFHIVVSKYYQSKTYKVIWSLDKHGDQAFAQLDLALQGAGDGTVWCEMRPHRKKLHPGEDKPKGMFESGHNWNCQDWRFEPYQGPLDARMAWVLLEMSCDWEGAAARSAEETMAG